MKICRCHYDLCSDGKEEQASEKEGRKERGKLRPTSPRCNEIMVQCWLKWCCESHSADGKRHVLV